MPILSIVAPSVGKTVIGGLGDAPRPLASPVPWRYAAAVTRAASPGAVKVPLAEWVSLHPLAAEVAGSCTCVEAERRDRRERSERLAEQLAVLNQRWGNDVRGELDCWLGGGDAVVTGQQPGLFGGPLLTLVKACAVAAEVRQRRAAGREAVGFLWLATADDDLEEMGWGRISSGSELFEVREGGWRRGAGLGGAAVLGDGCRELLSVLAEHATGDNARGAIGLARECYAPGSLLGDATGRFLARLLAASGVVLVDSREPEIARCGADVVERVLADLPSVWTALEEGAAAVEARGWSRPLNITPARLPIFRLAGDRRERVATESRRCSAGIVAEHGSHPERFLPNAWLRPLVQDAALDTSVAILGGAELAYHLQTSPARAAIGMGRPEWRLRPHVTVVTPAERRLAAQLRIEPRDLLRTRMPSHLLPGRALRREVESLRSSLDRRLQRLVNRVAVELPGAQADVQATARRLEGAIAWLGERLESGALRGAETEASRWQRLRTALRPRGRPQERELSVLSPLLRLGLSWPPALADALNADDPGMHLLFWGEGGTW